MKRLPGLLTAAMTIVAAFGVRAASPEIGAVPHDEAPAPCRVAGLEHEVQCGSVARLLDPARPDGPRISVRYVLVPAMARRKLPDPVFMLAGGPGQSAIAVAPSVMPLFARLNNRRDIVFVDQRGTGKSAPLECGDERALTLAEQFDSARTYDRLERCRETLQKLPYGDLRFFTTTLAMADLDAVREQIGAQRINVVGASYGTRAGLELLRQIPQRVRRLVLDGVAPPDMVLPMSFSTDGQSALEALLLSCEQASACAKAHPALRAEWAQVLAGLPRAVAAAHPLTGRVEQFTITREGLLQAVRAPLYVPAMASALPQAIHEAAQGRYEALLGVAGLLTAKRSSTLAMGMHFSVVCSEDMPRLASTQDRPGADFGDEAMKLYQRVCRSWPRGEVPAAFYEIPRSPVPVLLASGGLDPATPPRHAERVARALGAKALQVVVPNAGHGLMGIGCMRDVIFRFIDEAEDDDALKLDASCVKGIPRPPAFQPVTLGGGTP